MATSRIFLTCGTGYVGSRVAAELCCGHQVRALSRPGSIGRVPPGVEAVVTDALDAASYRQFVREGDASISRRFTRPYRPRWSPECRTS